MAYAIFGRNLAIRLAETFNIMNVMVFSDRFANRTAGWVVATDFFACQPSLISVKVAAVR
jgi:hypothetical protein